MEENLHKEMAKQVLLTLVIRYSKREKFTELLAPALSRTIFETIRSTSNLPVKEIERKVFGNDNDLGASASHDGRLWRRYANEGQGLHAVEARRILSTCKVKGMLSEEDIFIFWYQIDLCDAATRTIKKAALVERPLRLSAKKFLDLLDEMLDEYLNILQENKDKYSIKSIPNEEVIAREAAVKGSLDVLIHMNLASELSDLKKHPELT